MAGCQKSETPETGNEKPATGILTGVSVKLEPETTATTATFSYSIDLGVYADMPFEYVLRYSVSESLSGQTTQTVRLKVEENSYTVTGLQFDRKYYYELQLDLYGSRYSVSQGSFTTKPVSVGMDEPEETPEGLVLSGKVNGLSIEDKAEIKAVLHMTGDGLLEEYMLPLELEEDFSFRASVGELDIASVYEYWVVASQGKIKSVSGEKGSYRTADPYKESEKAPSSGSAADLSASGAANCYVVPGSGLYKFKLVKGNSNESVGEVESVRVLWESFGTYVKPSAFELISATSKDGDYAVFEVPQQSKEGNAVIAAYDAQDNILWSWHIWLTAADMEEITYANNAGVMMDRNLGALSSAVNDPKALGLFYQWGRKDPFLGSASLQGTSYAVATRYRKTVANTDETSTVAFATENPHVFILQNESGDWLATKDNSLWGSTKTIYDPCPAGWRIPEGGYNDGMGEQGLEDGIWAKAGIPSKGNYPFADIDYGKNGKVFTSQYCTPDTWYPAAGSIEATKGELFGLGVDGIYMSFTTFGNSDPCFTGLIIQYHSHQNIHYINCGGEKMNRAGGFSVRCCKVE